MNENFIFQHHDETGLLGEAMGDMFVVVGVQWHLIPHVEWLAHAHDKKKTKYSKKKQLLMPDGDVDDSQNGGSSVKVPFDPT